MGPGPTFLSAVKIAYANTQRFSQLVDFLFVSEKGLRLQDSASCTAIGVLTMHYFLSVCLLFGVFVYATRTRNFQDLKVNFHAIH